MMGIRTPVKKVPENARQKSPQSAVGEAGPSPTALREEKQTSVKTSQMRRDIDPTTSSSITTSRPNAEPKIKAQPQPAKLTTAEPRRMSMEPPQTPETYPNRTKEAAACLIKVKRQLFESRNIKREIKVAVLEAADRLYALVKEAEMELKTGKDRGMKETTGMLENTENTETESGALDRYTTKHETSQLMAKIEEHSKLLRESNGQMEELKVAIQAQNERMDNVEPSTYAGVTAAGNSSALKKRTLHSVVVTSSNEEDTGEEVYDRVRKAMDAKEGWIKVEKVRKAKNRKVIMGFETKEEREKVKERLRKNGVCLAVEEVKNKDPMMILRDVLLVNTDEDVLRAIRNQNRDIFHGLDGETDRIEIKYRRRVRNPHAGHIVVSTSPTIWRRATEKGYVHIDLQRIRVEDQTPLIQCTRCLGYGHSKKHCEEAVDMCSHCGGPHLRTECADWLAGVPAACRNCKKASSPHVEHNAFSAGCPQRRKWDQLARATVAYC